MHACVCTQLCLILCDPLDCSLPGSSVRGIFQAGILDLDAISSSRGSSWPRNRTCVSRFSCITGGFFTYTAKSLQSCPILCNPIDGSPPGSPIPGILQEITLEWVAISLYNAGKWKWSRSVVSDSSGPHGLQPTRLLHPWDFPGKGLQNRC